MGLAGLGFGFTTVLTGGARLFPGIVGFGITPLLFPPDDDLGKITGDFTGFESLRSLGAGTGVG